MHRPDVKCLDVGVYDILNAIGGAYVSLEKAYKEWRDEVVGTQEA